MRFFFVFTYFLFSLAFLFSASPSFLPSFSLEASSSTGATKEAEPIQETNVKTAVEPEGVRGEFFSKTSSPADGGNNTYDWDNNGNLTRQADFRGIDKVAESSYTWDEEDRLKEIRVKKFRDLVVTGSENIQDQILKFVYDDSGARVRKTLAYGNADKKATTYVRKGLSVVEEYTNTSTTLATGDAGVLSTIYAGGFLKVDGITGKKSYLYKDALGSTALVLDDLGKFQARYKVDPFGAEEYSESVTNFNETTMRFTGKEMDEESGLQYFGARYYDPFVGRWTGKDPKSGTINNAQSLNRYAYVLNNPLGLVDPDGKAYVPGTAGAIIGGSIGGLLGFVRGSLETFIQYSGNGKPTSISGLGNLMKNAFVNVLADTTGGLVAGAVGGATAELAVEASPFTAGGSLALALGGGATGEVTGGIIERSIKKVGGQDTKVFGLKEIGTDTAIGALGGSISFGLGKYLVAIKQQLKTIRSTPVDLGYKGSGVATSQAARDKNKLLQTAIGTGELAKDVSSEAVQVDTKK